MNKKFYKVLSCLVAIFLICSQVGASAALEKYKNTPVYRYQMSDEGDDSDDDDSESKMATDSAAESSSSDGSEHMTDDEEPEYSFDVPFAAGVPATKPVSSSSSSSSSSAAASVDASKGPQVMTIEQWENASMSKVLDDMGIFDVNQKNAITDAETGLLNKLYCNGAYGGPHVAVARLLFLTEKKTFVALNLPCVFISGTKTKKFTIPGEGVFVITISPYTSARGGADQSFAHSERAVGVYLLEQYEGKGSEMKDEINKIVCEYKCECVILQIKCALPPCDSCIKFWNGGARLECQGIGEPVTKKFCSESTKNAKSIDWLDKLRTCLFPNSAIGVSISCRGSVPSRCVSVKSLFERLLNRS